MRRLALAACLVMLGISGAPAHEPEPAPVSSRPIDQMIYKGVAGNLLDTMPIEPEARVNLQRANAVISNPLGWRSLGVLLGVANPAFLIGGLVWGLWSAANIEPAKTDMRWLVPRSGERVGFCGRPRQEGCQVHLYEETVPEAGAPAVEATAMVTPG